MTELLDIYDAYGNHIGVKDRQLVHALGLWHKTIHCWLTCGSRTNPSVIFQMRASTLPDNPAKLYTTASGHVRTGESLADAFTREIGEELGIPAPNNPQKLFEIIYKTDFKRRNGSDFHDRVFCNIYTAHTDIPLQQFHPQDSELDGVFAINIREALDLFYEKRDYVISQSYHRLNGEYMLSTTKLTATDFLCNPNETLIEKYARTLETILSKSQKF